MGPPGPAVPRRRRVGGGSGSPPALTLTGVGAEEGGARGAPRLAGGRGGARGEGVGRQPGPGGQVAGGRLRG